MPLEAVVFDVDGTLVDSNDAHACAWEDAFAEQRLAIPFARIRPLIGKGGDKLLPELVHVGEDEPLGKELSERRAAIFREKYLPKLRPFERADELVARIHGRWKVIVASSARAEELDALLDVARVRGLVHVKTSSSDIEKSKPDPDVVAVALERAKIAPANAVMIGDTPYDVAAARRAGVDAIGFRCGGWSDADLAGAIAIYDGPDDLFARFFESPLVRR